MSEENERDEGEGDALDKIMNIRNRKLNRFYGAHGQKKACEVCGSESWMILGDGDAPAVLQLRTYEASSFAVVFAISCTQCGNLRMTNAGFVLDWLESETKKNE